MSESPPTSNTLLAAGLALHTSGDVAGAAEKYREALAADAGNSGAWNNLAAIHVQRGDFEAAEASYRKVVALNPQFARAHYNLGRCLRFQERHAEAVSSYRQAIERGEPDPRVLVDLAWSLERLDDLHGAADVYRKLFALPPLPGYEPLYQAATLSLNLTGESDDFDASAVARLWHERFVKPAASARRPHDNSRDPERRLRVGYIGGPQMCTHTLAYTLLPLIEAHDPAQVELFAYSDLPEAREDRTTERYRKCMAWRRSAGLSHDDFAAQIRTDRIDILIDPISFTSGSRLTAMARRPAPIQMSYPVMGSCGGDTIDYVVADDHALPDRIVSQRFTERALRIPFPYLFRPPADLPSIGPTPARANGFVTFGMVNAFHKAGGHARAAWRRILDGVPGSRLLIKGGFAFRTEAACEAAAARLAAEGFPRERLIVRPWVTQHNAHLSIFEEIDIALDTFPYVGVTTTYDTLLMGVPVVTREGERPLERYSASILSHVGLSEGITRTDDDYVARAIALARDLQTLDTLRQTLRGKVLASPGCDIVQSTRAFEAALRAAWREWCAT